MRPQASCPAIDFDPIEHCIRRDKDRELTKSMI